MMILYSLSDVEGALDSQGIFTRCMECGSRIE